jgi:hypothetical protein
MMFEYEKLKLQSKFELQESEDKKFEDHEFEIK